MNRAVTIATVLAVLIGGGLWANKRFRGGPNAAGQTQYKIVKAENGQVKKTVAATGTLQAWTVVDIKSRAGGEVKELAVEVGDEVKKSQVIARIDPTDNLLNFSTAQADVDSARARQDQSGSTYRLQTRQSQIAIASARADLSSARANREAARSRLATARAQSKAQPALTRGSIAQAEAALNQSVRQRRQLNAINPQQRAAAKAAFDQAEANLKNARQIVERQQALLAKGFVSQQLVDTAQADVTVREAAVASAKARLDTIGDELAADVEAADARVAQARAVLDNARASGIEVQNRVNAVGEAEAALAQQNAAVRRAEAALGQAEANVANNQIRQYDVQAAKATIARAQATRTNAQTILDQTTVRAPSEGIVLQKYVEPGTIITSGLSLNAAGTSIVQIGDVSRMYINVTVDETDIASVDKGQSVEVTIDAYPGVPFEGKVARVDPQATAAQNVTTVAVRVEIDNSAPTFRLLKPGMNASCEFVVDEKDNVVSVPLEAVRENDQGRYVETASGGKPAPPDPKTGASADPDALVDVKTKQVPVEVGIEGNETVEIVSGLKAGDSVVAQTIEPETPAGPSSPFAASSGRGGFGSSGRR